MIGWMQRLLMPPEQKQLQDPAQYHAPLDRQQILKELDAGAAGPRCHETDTFMRRSVREVNEGGDLTIAHVARSYRSMQSALSRPHDRAYDNFGKLAACGDHALMSYLIQRANQLADGIQPGAKAELGKAFD